jgi:hypothetical protein
VEVDHEMEHSWAGSTKRIRLTAAFLVKAGFDLRKKFGVDIRPNDITIELPHAQILSVEQQGIEVLALENGLWNRISPTDIQNELAVLPDLARPKPSSCQPRRRRVYPRTFAKISPSPAGSCHLSRALAGRLGVVRRGRPADVVPQASPSFRSRACSFLAALDALLAPFVVAHGVRWALEWVAHREVSRLRWTMWTRRSSSRSGSAICV